MNSGVRLASLDALRGFAIASMVLVNNPGDWKHLYAPLAHARWNGWTFTDVVFPMFLFCAGVAMTLSLGRRAREGASREGSSLARTSRGRGFPRGAGAQFHPGVRSCDGAHSRRAAAHRALPSHRRAHRHLGRMARLGRRDRCAVCGVHRADVLGCGAGSGRRHRSRALEPGNDFGAWLDRMALGAHLWSQSRTWDPEGIVSTLPAVEACSSAFSRATTSCAPVRPAGTRRRWRRRRVGFLVAGLLLDMFIPINKNLWTPSYAVFMTGWSLLAFALFHAFLDESAPPLRDRARALCLPLTIFGMNALFIFAFSGLVARFLREGAAVCADSRAAAGARGRIARLRPALRGRHVRGGVAHVEEAMVRDGLSRRAALARLAALAAVASGCTTPVRVDSTPPDAPRGIPRRVDRRGLQHRLAEPAGPRRRSAAGGSAKPRARRAILGLNALILQVRPARRCALRFPLRAVVRVPHRRAGTRAAALLRSARLLDRGSPSRGAGIARLVQPVSRAPSSARSALDARHIAKTHPQIVKAYGDSLWMDPGEPAAADRALAVILDVVRRYDVDGVHIDDYFYPYPVKGADGADLAFPDDVSWRALRRLRRHSSRARTGAAPTWMPWWSASTAKCTARTTACEVGVSPFGIGRPDRRPPGIAGFSQFDAIYADVGALAAKMAGWITSRRSSTGRAIRPKQPFAPLLAYWQSQNPLGRDIWPGLFTSRIDGSANSWTPEEIARQVALARAAARTATSTSAWRRWRRTGAASSIAFAMFTQLRHWCRKEWHNRADERRFGARRAGH